MRSYIVFIMLLLGMNMNVMAQSETLHIVKRGESFALIAKRYGMTEEELKAANPDYSVCYMGLKLNIPEKYAKAIQVTSVASSESVSGLSASYSQEDFTKSATVASKQEKKKGNFWKKLGDIASNVGDIAVSVASGMDEAGLLDKTGKAGEAIGGTADMVNMLRGQESSYLVSATGEDKYVSEENVDCSMPISSAASANDATIAEIDRQIAALQKEDEMLEGQRTQSLMKGVSTTRGQGGSARRSQNKRLASMSSSSRVTKSTMKKDLEIAKRQSEIQRQIRALRKQKADLLGDPSVIDEKSAFERERSIRSKVYNDPKVRKTRMKAANIRNYQKSRDVAIERKWKLENDPDYCSEYDAEERARAIYEAQKDIEKYTRLIEE